MSTPGLLIGEDEAGALLYARPCAEFSWPDEDFAVYFINELDRRRQISAQTATEENEPPHSAWDKMRERWQVAVARVIPVGLAKGDAVVFTGSNPATRREWVIEEIERSRHLPETAPRTCTIRRGSTVKRGVSLSRLEKAAG